ncbi:MAG: ribbon-helix-helix domain-containing protein [Rhodospirillaceae bacterium]|jgi:predicted DNA-binding ribbon-helix-helix protein
MSKKNKRSVTIAGHRTSVSLEAEFWAELTVISQNEDLPLGKLISKIDENNPNNLSSALRLYVLADLKNRLALKDRNRDAFARD